MVDRIPSARSSSSPSSGAVRCAIYARKSVKKKVRKRRGEASRDACEGDVDDVEIDLDPTIGSCDAQRDLCQALVASRPGWVVLDTVYADDGYSGGDLRRPALQRLLEDVEAGRVDRIIVYRVDRLSRSLFDFVGLNERLVARGVGLVSTREGIFGDSADGRFHLGLTLLLAQRERELAGERTADRARAAKARGLCVGAVPFGSRLAADGLSLEDDPDEQAAIRCMLTLRRAGKGARAIATELGRRGYPSRGESWHATTVARVLERAPATPATTKDRS